MATPTLPRTEQMPSQPKGEAPKGLKPAASKTATSNQGSSSHGDVDRKGLENAYAIVQYVRRKGGEFVRDDDECLSIKIEKEVIPLNAGTPDYPNIRLSRIFAEVCLLAGVTTPVGRATLAALQVQASVLATSVTSIRRFSGLSEDGKRLYLPVSDGVICLSAKGIRRVENTVNEDLIYIEAARDQKPFAYVTGDPKQGLRAFEECLIDSMAIRVPEMAYLLAIQLLLIPWLRSQIQDRFICLMKGPSGAGKSTAARFLSRLQGWNELKGDYSVAALRASGDSGVRCQVQAGDVVVYFAFTKLDRLVEYRLSAVATVERKLRHSDVFCDASYQKYTQYLNLLVRPLDGTGKEWQHHEPGSPEKDWHDDWLSRIVPFKFFSKSELERQAKTHRVSTDTYIDGKQFRFGNNYVLFSDDPNKTLVLEEPPTIADAQPPQEEVWRNDVLSHEVFKRTVDKAQPRGVTRLLRLDNKIQQPHSPPIRWELSESDLRIWRERFFELLLAHNLKPC
jgi:hypothetical protein